MSGPCLFSGVWERVGWRRLQVPPSHTPRGLPAPSSCPQPPWAAPQGPSFPVPLQVTGPPGMHAPGNPASCPDPEHGSAGRALTTRNPASPLGFPGRLQPWEGQRSWRLPLCPSQPHRWPLQSLPTLAENPSPPARRWKLTFSAVRALCGLQDSLRRPPFRGMAMFFLPLEGQVSLGVRPWVFPMGGPLSPWVLLARPAATCGPFHFIHVSGLCCRSAELRRGPGQRADGQRAWLVRRSPWAPCWAGLRLSLGATPPVGEGTRGEEVRWGNSPVLLGLRDSLGCSLPSIRSIRALCCGSLPMRAVFGVGFPGLSLPLSPQFWVSAGVPAWYAPGPGSTQAECQGGENLRVWAELHSLWPLLRAAIVAGMPPATPRIQRVWRCCRFLL